jgi:hypothetical protein
VGRHTATCDSADDDVENGRAGVVVLDRIRFDHRLDTDVVLDGIDHDRICGERPRTDIDALRGGCPRTRTWRNVRSGHVGRSEADDLGRIALEIAGTGLSRQVVRVGNTENRT